MTRSRAAVVVAMTIVAVAVVAGVGALWLNPARAAVGPLPAEALVLPADARFVSGIDVPRFVASPFYRRFASQPGMKPKALAELEAKTGLDPARDLQQIVVAGGGPASQVIAIAVGRYDSRKLARALESEGKAQASVRGGVTLYSFKGDSGPGTALALLGGSALALGSSEAVLAAAAARSRGETPLRSNAALLARVEKVRPGSTFWMVGDQSLLANLPSSIPTPGGSGPGAALNLPALKGLTVTGDLDPQIALSLTGETADEVAARNLADVVRGLVAIAALQAQRKPELQQLASAVSVATEANRVLVSLRLPYELLDALQPKPSAAPAPPAPGTAR
jgi:hypothetical protein